MTRTTLDLDAPILKDLKRLSRKTGKSLGRLASELLARGLAEERAGAGEPLPKFRWIARPLEARLDLEDKEALWEALEGPYRGRSRAEAPGEAVAEPEAEERE